MELLPLKSGHQQAYEIVQEFRTMHRVIKCQRQWALGGLFPTDMFLWIHGDTLVKYYKTHADCETLARLTLRNIELAQNTWYAINHRLAQATVKDDVMCSKLDEHKVRVVFPNPRELTEPLIFILDISGFNLASVMTYGYRGGHPHSHLVDIRDFCKTLKERTKRSSP